MAVRSCTACSVAAPPLALIQSSSLRVLSRGAVTRAPTAAARAAAGTSARGPHTGPWAAAPAVSRGRAAAGAGAPLVGASTVPLARTQLKSANPLIGGSTGLARRLRGPAQRPDRAPGFSRAATILLQRFCRVASLPQVSAARRLQHQEPVQKLHQFGRQRLAERFAAAIALLLHESRPTTAPHELEALALATLRGGPRVLPECHGEKDHSKRKGVSQEGVVRLPRVHLRGLV
mmetsp:Transcript_95977/g.222473  ORF Transcript_95977/g.222473 Transcript_95977/m.222473 type:complete len:233 (+) Transcript_95977:135-833(+)